MKYNLKFFLNFLLVLVIVTLYVHFFMDFKDNKVGDIVVHISNPQKYNFISEKVIIKKINDRLKKVDIKNLDIEEIKKIVRDDNCVKKVDVSISPNSNLKITIEQRIPICRVFETNMSYFLDFEGVLIKNKIDFSPEVILVTGKIDKENKIDIISLVNKINSDIFLKKQIIGIDIDENDEVDLHVLKGDYVVKLGSIDKLDEKFMKLKVFYQKYMGTDIINNYKQLNLKFENQIIGVK